MLVRALCLTLTLVLVARASDWAEEARELRGILETRRGTLSDDEAGDHWARLARALVRGGDVPAATDAFETALALSSRTLAEAELALLLEKSGDAHGAAEWYERALKLRPGNAAQLVQLGWQYHALGQTARAVRKFVAATKLEPSYARRTHYKLAALLGDVGDFGGAAAALDKFLALQPDDAPALFRAAAAHHSVFSADVTKLSGADFKSAEGATAVRAPSKGAARHLGRAVEYARRCVELEPEHPNAATLLADAEREQARWGDLKRGAGAGGAGRRQDQDL